MKTQYFVKYSMRLDEVVYNYYGSLDMFEATLELNPTLSDTIILEAGTLVYLEEKQTVNTETTQKNLKALW